VQITPDYEGGFKNEPGDPIELTLVADPQGRAVERRSRARSEVDREEVEHRAEGGARSQVSAASMGVDMHLR
jgi:hypothetical protein